MADYIDDVIIEIKQRKKLFQVACNMSVLGCNGQCDKCQHLLNVKIIDLNDNTTETPPIHISCPRTGCE